MSMDLLYGLFGAFILLNICDIISTLEILDAGGYERNPIVAWAMRKLGDAKGLIAIKAGMFAVLGIALYFFRNNAEIIFWGLVVANMLYTFLLVNNVWVYSKLGRK